MRLNTLEPLWPSLDREEPEITMDEPLQLKTQAPIKKRLTMSR